MHDTDPSGGTYDTTGAAAGTVPPAASPIAALSPPLSPSRLEAWLRLGRTRGVGPRTAALLNAARARTAA